NGEALVQAVHRPRGGPLAVARQIEGRGLLGARGPAAHARVVGNVSDRLRAATVRPAREREGDAHLVLAVGVLLRPLPDPSRGGPRVPRAALLPPDWRHLAVVAQVERELQPTVEVTRPETGVISERLRR